MALPTMCGGPIEPQPFVVKYLISLMIFCSFIDKEGSNYSFILIKDFQL